MLKRFKRWITTKETKISRDKNYQIARFISILICFQGLIMFSISMFSKDYKEAIIPLSYSILMLLVYIHTTYSQKLYFFYTISTLLILFLEVNFLYQGGTDGFGIIWMLSIPLFTIYLFGIKFFYIINSIFLGILIIGMWTPVHYHIYLFSESFRIRFPLVYILEFLFGTFLKYRINKTEKDLELQKNTLTKEIQQAAYIQSSFFKQHISEFMDWNISYCNIPMAGVSGDLYDSYCIGPNLHGIGIFDVSGHGISSGLITMLVKNIIQQEFYKDRQCELNKTVDRINRRFIREKGEIENYLTGILVRIEGNKLELVNAGHQYPLIYRKLSNTFEQIKKLPESMGPIGMKSIEPVYLNQFINMECGDELILFTDGITDTKNPKGEKYGLQRFIESLQKNIDRDIEIQIETVITELKIFQNKAATEDDVTIMILQKD